MKFFAAALATETNTFSPIPTDLEAFREGLLARPGQHPDTPTLCTAPLVAARRRAQREGWTLVEGTSAWADPGGTVSRQTYETLRGKEVEFTQEPVDRYGSVDASFRDPSGNGWKLIQAR